MLTFGGDGGNDTWRFALDGSGFSAVSAAGIPPVVRNAHAMIYDPVRQRVLVFGGRSTTAYLNDLHALSIGGTPTWSSIAASGSPPAPREGSQAIYDPIRDRMVVWGGLNDANRFTDVWALDLAGTPTWSQLVADGGLSGFYPGSPAVYDSRRDRLVVMGATIAETHTKAWALPVTGPPSWTPLAGGTSVTQRFYISAAYDSVNDRVLTFGGASDDFTSTLGDLLALDLSPGE